MLTIIGLIVSAISAVGGLSAVVLLRGKWKIDQHTLAQLETDRDEADRRRDKERRLADEERDRKRREDDEARLASLRSELGELSKLSYERFQSWRAAQADLDEVWEYIDLHQPWDVEAYEKLRLHGINISRPPRLKPRSERGARARIQDDPGV
jgi:hypothetical protein